MLEAVFPREASGPAWDPAPLREANERWLGEHLGLDFQAWMAEIDGRVMASAGLLWFPHPRPQQSGLEDRDDTRAL